MNQNPKRPQLFVDFGMRQLNDRYLGFNFSGQLNQTRIYKQIRSTSRHQMSPVDCSNVCTNFENGVCNLFVITVIDTQSLKLLAVPVFFWSNCQNVDLT
jgi:hypothetical protein